MNNEELIREKALRKLNAGLYARSVWPEDQAFYMTHSFTLDEDVSPDALKKALDAAIQVWPYMALSVVKQDRTYVLKENGLEFVIRETGERIEPSTEAGNYHAVTICYEGRKLNFYVDHILTDGLGWKMVLETFSTTISARWTETNTRFRKAYGRFRTDRLRTSRTTPI